MGCRLLVLVVLVFSLLFLWLPASAQQAQPSSVESGEKSAPEVAPDAPVITLEGSCAAGTAVHEGSTKSDGASSDAAAAAAATAPVSATPTDSDCKVVITRAEFEKLSKAMHPGSPSATRSLANHYSEMVLLAEKAHEAGYDQDPAIQAKARFTYLQIVGQGFSMQLRENARVVSDAEVEAYYKEHPEMFEQVELMRIFIPSLKSYDPEPQLSEEQLAADKTKLEAEARKIYAQALAGVSFEKLEERAYKAAGNPEDTPPVNLGKLTRNAIPQQYSDLIFGLKIGQISELTPESNGWSIFKVVSKRTMPLSEAKSQVQQLKADAALSAVKNSMKIKLNDAYFGPPTLTTNAPNMRK